MDDEKNPDIVSLPDSSDDVESFIEGDAIYYTTGKLASILGISRDMVRNHIKDFEEYLNVVYSNSSSKGRHMRLKSTDVQLLESIIRMRKNRSVAETKRVLDEPDMRLLIEKGTGMETTLGQMFIKNNEFLLKKISEIMNESSQARETLLLEQNQELQKGNDELRDDINNLKSIIGEQGELLQQQSELIQNLTDKLNEPKTNRFLSMFKGKKKED